MTITPTARVIHFDASFGINLKTACGKSLHGWNVNKVKNTTFTELQVTCKSCRKKLIEQDEALARSFFSLFRS